ncbi:uncharacterized protein LOC131857984 [Cryptomeria japonica]|uniref:uncharacterized protein LOC131857984 n=1 Tax=Cryptomeria japonica TaxID=3369 RepID=UPI0027D9D4F9|nr:uncharacterized protein LOC131857984 [Cryptomeria japonica]
MTCQMMWPRASDLLPRGERGFVGCATDRVSYPRGGGGGGSTCVVATVQGRRRACRSYRRRGTGGRLGADGGSGEVADRGGAADWRRKSAGRHDREARQEARGGAAGELSVGSEPTATTTEGIPVGGAEAARCAAAAGGSEVADGDGRVEYGAAGACRTYNNAGIVICSPKKTVMVGKETKMSAS